MPRTSAAKATCPRPEHAGSRVHLDGTYGRPGHRRQRYKCFPAGDGRAHVFTELLPREESWRVRCESCERQVERHEGPQAARKYQFVARGIAGALVAVGAGATYQQAALVARERASRFPIDYDSGELRETRHGQLVADWVELFAPVVFEPHRPQAWPSAGSLVIDSLPFRVRNPLQPGRAPVAFSVFCAMGYVAGRPRMWRMEAFTDASAPSWEAFLRSLPGAPTRVVCELHYGQRAALRRLWPESEVYLCEWHLQHALERLCRNERRRNPQHAEAIDALMPRIERAFDGRQLWRPFVREVRGAAIEALDLWLDEMDPLIEDQFARRGSRSTRPPDMPLSTGGLEQLARPVKDTIYRRRFALKNRKRLNRLLLLMQLHLNGLDSQTAYTTTIRDWLTANGGRPRGTRRAIADRRGAPSLR